MRNKGLLGRTYGNQKGQSAIFVALMFNVLFVFFAMAINVALVIHDKINLQNSVDMGVYYAAEKQAEILNAMAHENYMIRQSWKLLSWRYRVLGTMGLDRQGVAHPIRTGIMSDTPFQYAQTPSLCMTYKPTWEEVPPNENLCNSPQTQIPPLPQVKVIAGFLGINYGIAALSRQLRIQFDNQCDKNGAFNWWFAASILHSFRLDQRNRKRVIYGLADGLASKKDDFVDLDGNSVLEGVRQTIMKNLTYANRERGVDIQLFNSMGGIDHKLWLSEIQIAPTMIYTDVKNIDGCFATPKVIQNLPEKPSALNILNTPVQSGGLGATDLIQWKDESFLRDSDYQYSMGVEKNPWYMPYVAVKIETNPRQIFYPVSGALKMVARAFAKPFGGRMGPWYGNKWDRGAQNSTGSETDHLLPPRMSAGGLMDDPNDPRRLPNYSRYPGDALGLISNMAQNGLESLAQLTSRFQYYMNIKADFSSGGANDVLAWNGEANQVPKIRQYEEAIISPDLFDITYYSIEPNFTKNYLERLTANKVRLGIPSDVVIRSDLGSNSNIIPTFSVQEQMSTGKSLQKSQAFFFVRDKAHLLTSWAPGANTYNYGTAGLDFLGKCALNDDNFKVKNPGSCVAGGGRTGYSVKLVSRDYLLSNRIGAGGPSSSPNAILNPPPSGW
jgi:hypothetical protein